MSRAQFSNFYLCAALRTFHTGADSTSHLTEKRAIREGLSKEELALFDIITKPVPDMTEKEIRQVKAMCRKLLATLKREKLVLDWRKKEQSKAEVT